MNTNTAAVPIFEAKNKLPFFIHQAEENGPVRISRHNEVVAYIVSKEDFEKSIAPKEKSLVERIQESRIAYGLEDDDFDLTEYYDSIRERGYYGKSDSEHLFED